MLRTNSDQIHQQAESNTRKNNMYDYLHKWRYPDEIPGSSSSREGSVVTAANYSVPGITVVTVTQQQIPPIAYNTMQKRYTLEQLQIDLNTKLAPPRRLEHSRQKEN
jgi:hypothetical protein